MLNALPFNSLNQFEYSLEYARNQPDARDLQTLNQFDPTLRLWFSERRSRWFIVQLLPGNKYPQTVMCLQDKDGNAKPFGNWAIATLWNMRCKMETKDDWNKYFDNLEYEMKKQEAIEKQKSHELAQDMIVDNITQWRKAEKEICGGSVSDVTAGYQKIDTKPKKKRKKNV